MADDSDNLQVIALIPGADRESLEIVMRVNQTERHFHATHVSDDIPHVIFDDELNRLLWQHPWVTKEFTREIIGYFLGRPVQLPLTFPGKGQR
jgi:hypothetical protein